MLSERNFKPRVLLVEPNSSHLELLATLILNDPLKGTFECHRAEGKDAALSALKQWSYKLILSSDMVDDTPPIWLSTLRALQPLAHLVLLTTSNDPNKTRHYMLSGADDVILKSQENLHTFPEILRRHLFAEVEEHTISKKMAHTHKVKKILNQLNRLSQLPTSISDFPHPFRSIKRDLESLTKIVRDLL